MAKRKDARGPATAKEVMDALDFFVAGTTDESEKQAVRRAMAIVREVLGSRLEE